MNRRTDKMSGLQTDLFQLKELWKDLWKKRHLIQDVKDECGLDIKN